jgi:transcription antitermination factor NusG
MSSRPLAVSTEETDSEAAWYAVYTRHQHEKTVASLLVGKGIQVFLPLYSAVHKWKDREKKLLLPLYPGYVFLRDRLDRKLQILTTPGVHSIVGTAGRPEPIPEFEIEAVRCIVERSIAVKPYPFIRCGDWVRVMHGPLEGIEGFLLRKKNAYRLVLSVEMLMKSVAVEIDASMVERISNRKWSLIGRECERPLNYAY